MSSQPASAKRIPDALWVYGPDGLVGTLHNTDPLSFSYAETWLATPGAGPIVPGLPLVPGQVETPAVHLLHHPVVTRVDADVGLGRFGAQAFSDQVLTNPSGFIGIDGAFRFLSNGTNERGLAIYQINRGQLQVVDPAPKSFARGGA